MLQDLQLTLEETNLDYHNISLVSNEISTISSREEIDTSVEFCGVKLEMPIIASPMKDVVSAKSAKIIMDAGAFAIHHRFCPVEEQVAAFKEESRAGCAIGLNDIERFGALHKEGCNIFCIDVANGANTNVTRFLNQIDDYLNDNPNDLSCHFIVGNVCSNAGYEYLSQNSVDAVRISVGGGSGCSTKNATGIYMPTLSLLKECKSIKEDQLSTWKSNKGNLPGAIIADGGIKEPGDMCKALAFGADVVMIGGQLAACLDSPAPFADGVRDYKTFSGSASFENQQTYKAVPKYVEGITRTFRCYETITQFLSRYQEGLKSCMSYFNARNLEEFRENVDYVKT